MLLPLTKPEQPEIKSRGIRTANNKGALAFPVITVLLKISWNQNEMERLLSTSSSPRNELLPRTQSTVWTSAAILVGRLIKGQAQVLTE